MNDKFHTSLQIWEAFYLEADAQKAYSPSSVWDRIKLKTVYFLEETWIRISS
jgi:hypothetical protein